MGRRALALRAALLVVALAFAYFVWPTPYRYVELPAKLQPRAESPLCCFAVRVQRFTSEVQVLDLDGWLPLSLKRGDSTAKATVGLLTR